MQMQKTPKITSISVNKGWARTIGAGIASIGLLAAIAGCGSGSSGSSSLVRSLNAFIPPAGSSSAITVSAGSTALTNGLALGFGQFGNGGSYVSVPSGVFTPTATGTGVATTIQALTPTTLVGNKNPYTLVVGGQAGQTGLLAPQIFDLPNFIAGQMAIPTNSAAIRVVNVSVSPNPIGLYNANSGVPASVVNPAFTSVSYGYSSAANGYVLVSLALLSNFAIVDTTAPQTALSIVNASTLNNYIFIPGQAYTLYIFGQPGNSTAPLSASWFSDYPIQ